MNELKILHVVNIPLEEESITGVFTRRQISYMSRYYNVDVYSTHGSSRLVGIIRLVHLLIIKSRRYDIVHAHQSLLILFSALFVSRKAVFVGSMLSDSHHNFRFKCARLNKFLFSLTTYLCDGLIVKNQRSLTDAKCKYTRFIPNSVDTDMFRIRDVNKSDFGLDPQTKYLGFVSASGVARPEKRFDLFESLLARVREFSIPVAPLVMSNHSPKQMSNLYNCCDLLILTSDFEGSPNCVKEALACGIPVFARDVGDISYWLSNQPNCQIMTGDVNSYSSELIELLRNGPFERETIRDQFLERLKTEKETMEMIINLYRELLCQTT